MGLRQEEEVSGLEAGLVMSTSVQADAQGATEPGHYQ